MEREERFLCKWLVSKTNTASDGHDMDLKEDLFASGRIDSFGVIELIAEIENEFAIEFSELHFQDRRFRTINGISEIIREAANEQLQS